ncbi:hypothetical protein MIMGU_mgv1a018485mg [Erythranthe guttata]|uniref:ASCH domain-containing protein n=1 Tax=Erythranthe guttata TaxID=4155 RepID=A0A022RLW9_ERYGU|nr:hypothetical protein MIMGU_mgv1a018485mg [Erythranthe guttata]
MEPPPQPPSSPGVSPIKLKECMEELLKFTLLSSIQGKLQTGLSDEYCDGLLRDDPSNLLPITNETCKGVPSYPLYKRVASSLYESIHSGAALFTACKELIPAHEDQCLNKNDEEWNNLIMEKGSALLRVLNEVDFELHVQEPFFSQLNDGLTTVEGRCATGDYKRIQSGHLLLFNKCLILEFQDVRYYASFPCKSVEIYRNFYSEEKERSNGVIAICVTKPTSQLYVIMASILSGLSCGGVQKLLGFVETIGTNPELLPPTTSTLLSTFLATHNPHVKGSTLTNGARALSKHINRSNFEKNRQAVEVINRVMSECIWMNMHIVQPHGCIFEIRTRDGYGARWSGDGIKFIGFLEPYEVDGHSKGWKH